MINILKDHFSDCSNKSLKISVIDIGSNTIKLVNYDITRNNLFTAYQQESSKVRLGDSLSRTHELGEQSMLKAIDVLLLYCDIIKLESVKNVICIGTSALREAKNGEYFADQVFRKTGLMVNIITGSEEAYYAYLGASMSTCFPSALYFDLGGGSLELVYTENYKIKRADSLPLGALRLGELYGKKDGSYSKKDLEAMVQYIREALPNRKTYGLGIDTILVGSGGTLRALARYDQISEGYLFEKIHNYRLKINSIEPKAKEFGLMKPGEISALSAMDSTRAETVVAGTFVILTLMKQYDFTETVVSAFGLREGVLASYLDNPDIFQSHNMQNLERQITELVSAKCKRDNHYFGMENLVQYMVSNGLLKERESEILSYALDTMARLPASDRIYTQFYSLLDEIYPDLSNREQLVLALSIVYSKKVKAAEWLVRKHELLLKPQNQKSIWKIGILLKLGYLLIKSRSRTRIRKIERGRIIIDIISTQKSFPKVFLQYIIQKMGDVFDISIQININDNTNSSKTVDNSITLKSKL